MNLELLTFQLWHKKWWSTRGYSSGGARSLIKFLMKSQPNIVTAELLEIYSSLSKCIRKEYLKALHALIIKEDLSGVSFVTCSRKHQITSGLGSRYHVVIVSRKHLITSDMRTWYYFLILIQRITSPLNHQASIFQGSTSAVLVS